ncbi:MAG: biopolymer transporter ExbD [Bdellovibrionales bacterium]|nr:biopolymer transporter ExbD [Bdellovibrionales bacterium]
MSTSKKKKRRKQVSGDLPLQITSMADIFMILLVFLLKNYATSMTNISATTKITLPEVKVSGNEAPKESLKIEIGKDTILVDQKPVYRLDNFEIPKGPDGNPPAALESVTVALNEYKKNSLDRGKNDSFLAVLADENVPYATIQKLVATAAGSGFVDLQLIVVNAE